MYQSGPKILGAAWVSFKADSAQYDLSCINGNPLPTWTLYFLLYFNAWYLQETKSYFTALVSKSRPPVFPLSHFFSYLESTFLLCPGRTDDLACTSLWNTFYSQAGSLWSFLHWSFLKRHVFPPWPHCPCFWDDVLVLSSRQAQFSAVTPASHQHGSASASDSRVFSFHQHPSHLCTFLLKKTQNNQHPI